MSRVVAVEIDPVLAGISDGIIVLGGAIDVWFSSGVFTNFPFGFPLMVFAVLT